MGILRNGFYTRGYKTTEEIYDMTEMRYGDTVFDTTRKERRIYDGAVWVTGNMITKTFQVQINSTYGGGIFYWDTAKCGQLVSYYAVGAGNPTGQKVSSLYGTNSGNVENGIGVMQFPIQRSYGESLAAAVQYSGEAFIQTQGTSFPSPGSYVVPYTVLDIGGFPGNYWQLWGKSTRDLVRGPGQIGVYTAGWNFTTNVTSATTPKGYEGTITLGRAVIRFGETN
jgi:hypothetical protein